jgi:hypothetical protein
LKRNKLFTFLLLLCFVIGLTAISVPELHAAPLPYGISGLLENDPRHMSYSPDSDYGKPEYLYDTITLTGSGMKSGEKIYSVKDIEELYEDGSYGCDVTYSITGSEGRYSTFTLSGVRLYELLVMAGMDDSLDDDTAVTFVAKDGYNSVRTLGDIQNTAQYNYYNEAGESQASNLPVLLAFASNGYPLVGPIGFQSWFDTDIDGLSEENANGGGPLKVTFGQTGPGDNNAQYNGKLLTRIIIGDDDQSSQHNRAPYSAHGDDELTIQLIDSATSEVTSSDTYSVTEIESMVNAKTNKLVHNFYPDTEANYYEGIDLWYLLSNEFGLTGNEGEVSFVDASGNESDHINLDYLSNSSKDYSAYYTTKAGLEISWVKPMLAYAQNGEPLQNSGPLLTALPQHDTYLSNGLVQACTGINVYIVQDTCMHSTEPYSNWKDDEISFTGDGLNTSHDFTVEDLEQMLELIQEDSYTVDSETAAYRGINLYSLLTSDELGLKMETESIEVASRDGSKVSFTLDELQDSALKVRLAYGKNGKPLVPSVDAAGYDASALNSGGPIYLVVDGDPDRCLTQITAVTVTAAATESWKHDREAPYDAYLDTTFLRIAGSEIAQPAVYSLRELEAMDAGIVREYLVASEVMGYYEGLDLKYLLQTAGIDSMPAKITVCSPNADGTIFAKPLVVEDVWSGISSTAQSGAIKPVVLAYAKDGYPLVNSLDPETGYVTAADNGYGPLRLVVENTKPACVKYVAGIIVGDGTPAAYTVNYLDKDSGEVLRAAKVSVGTDGESITPEAETISITGYEYSDADQDTLTLSASAPDNNVLNLYYQKEKADTKITDIGLVISGSGVPKIMYLTMDEMESIAAGEHATIESVFRSYSVMARGGIKTFISTKGIDLGTLLQQAGVGTDSYIIKTISSDSNRVDLNYNGTSKSFEPQRYYFADMLLGDNGESGPIDPILALFRTESNENDINPHLPTQDELTEVLQFPLPTLTIGQTSMGDFNNQFNNKYVQQVIVGDDCVDIFSISGDGLSKEKAYTIPELMLKGMEKKTLQGKSCEGISLQRLLNEIDDLDDSAMTSLVTGASDGVTIFHKNGKLEHVTGLVIGSEDDNAIMLSELMNPDNSYFLAYSVEGNTSNTTTGGGGGSLIPRGIYLTQTTGLNPEDLMALQDRPYVNMELYAARTTDGKGKEKIALKDEAKQVIQEAESGSVLLFTASSEITDFTLEISSAMLSEMQDKDMYLQINTAQGDYIIQADALDMIAIVNDSGSEDFMLQIRMSELSADQAETLKASLPENYILQSVPLSTDIICMAGEKQIKIDHFNNYIFRDLLLNGEVMPLHSTVLCWDSINDAPRVVPSVFLERNGADYARAYNRSNSIYAVVSGSKTFADIQNHTAQNDIEILASKLIVNGRNSQEFDPDATVNRAELAAMLVRALGLKEPSGQQTYFNDVNGEEWFADSIAAAARVKIINGMPDGSFQPLRTVNRQEAIVMMANAMQMTGMNFIQSDEENKQLTAGFSDNQDIAGWAYQAAAMAVKNGLIKGEGVFDAGHKLSRAESAALVAGLLRATGLIDERSTLSSKVSDPDTTSPTSNNNIDEADKGILVVDGTALVEKKLYSLEDLKAMTDIEVTDYYFSRGKVKDGWAAEQHDTFTGVSLYKLLLDKIGLKTIPTEIQVIGDDGYTKFFTLEEVTGLYIDETNPKAKLEMIIAWSRNGSEFNQDQPFRIVFGQKYEGDFNRQNWVNYVKKIFVY